MRLSRFSFECIAFAGIGLGIVDGPGLAIAQRPLGIDVSSYQGGSINWTEVKNSGVTFAWAKATEGTFYIDADFNINEVNAKAAGVYIGAYHFAHPEEDIGTAGADAEAAYFWNEVKNYLVGGGVYLVPMLDFETSYSTSAYMSDWINEWCNDVKNYAAANGAVCNPVVYTDGSIASDLESPATNWPLDIADPNGESPETGVPTVSLGPWGTWTFWQYGQGTVPGVTTGACDEDVLNGSASTLQLFLISTSGTSAGAGVTLNWNKGNGGTGTWDNGTANWLLTGTGDVAWSTGGDYGNFGGTAGTITLGASVTADGLAFNTAGYIVTGSDTLSLNSPANINVVSGTPTYIECVLGGVGYNVSGGGVLVLNNANNGSGSGTSAEFVTGPGTTLVVASDHDVGNSGVTLNLEAGGIYQNNDTTSGHQFLLSTVDDSYDSAIALLSGGGIFDNPNASLTMSDYITGPGSLTTIGTTYTLTLTDTGNSYTGGTIVQSGTLKASAAGVLGATANSLTVTGGILDLGGASHRAGAVTITGGTVQDGTLTGSSYTAQGGTVSAVLAGSASMSETNSGTLILTGVNTYSGGTTIGGGAVCSIAADSALGAAASALALNGGCLKNDDSAPALNSSRTITLGTNGGYVDAGWAPSEPITINGKITGAGQLLINLDGSPVVLASTANNYTGNTIIGTNGPGYYATGTQAWLKLGASGVMPNGAGYGNVTINGTYDGLLDLAGFTQTINGLSGNGTINNSTGSGSLSVGNNNQTSTFSGVIKNTSGTLTLTKVGTGTLTLSGVNTYGGNTTISAGTLALGSGGSISNTPAISIAAGATLDVSAIASFALSASTTLSASGTSSAATIKGGTTVNLGSRPITLAYDGSHSALTISQGTLSLDGNTFTVNGTQLAGGRTYTLVQQASGNIASSGSYSVTGTAIGVAGTTAAISVSGGNVILTITDTTTTTLNSPTPSTYGQSVTFTATVAPAPAGGTVQFFDNSVALGAPEIVSGGTAAYSTNTLAVGNHPITASYSGASGYSASSTVGASDQQVMLPPNSAPVTINSVTLLGSGAVQMNFTGIAGYTYLIEGATNLNPPVAWTNLSTNVADINGLFNFTDSTATNYPDRYYRTAIPQ